ncbi:hypothetical protein LPE01_06050 [Lactiplantibacillus pentosus]|nr:hypothetical protein LPE01_06050 [Lactiplantibacillus pentosus]
MAEFEKERRVGWGKSKAEEMVDFRLRKRYRYFKQTDKSIWLVTILSLNVFQKPA